MDWSCKVIPITTGFYRGIRRIGLDKLGEANGAGERFTLGPTIFKLNSKGEVHVTKEGKPVLPTWVKPVEEVPKLPAGVPSIVIDTLAAKAKRKRPAIMDQDKVRPFEDRFRFRGKAPNREELLRQMEEDEAASRPSRPATAKA